MNEVEAVIAYFGSKYQLAKALGISRPAVTKWNDCIPIGRAYQIEVLTDGKFKAENLIYKPRRKRGP